ncbi:hypothetical protein QH494_16090 [Sphingomonas sp. AR_OL41]|uniref:DUF968 domain-containing protein n=1 Tax=Sphingomonas sp. AR_OL41 TaxID=3042729 RepID=UPI002480E826|nr:hypothetical protein [Sphingomonas sp. AR_OL41]MDH7973713.1 hypothetical protein [Sphingomonas sp. AR_OL41]
MLAYVDTRPRHRNSHRADQERRCPSHLQWLRGRRCCVEGAGCSGRMVAAHVDHAGGKGMAIKVADWKAVPLCDGHHAELHRGARTFEARHGIDLIGAAAAFARRSPHRASFA